MKAHELEGVSWWQRGQVALEGETEGSAAAAAAAAAAAISGLRGVQRLQRVMH